jgi:hypothetical protein
MGDAAGPHFHGGGGMPFGGGFGHGPGGGGMHMSQQEADLLFSHIFGGADPFGATFGGSRRGGPRMSFQSQGGRPGGGGGNIGMDPFGSMFMGGGPMGGGFPGGSMNGMPAGFGHPQQQQQQRRRVKRYDTIPVGTVVSLKGLQSQPERNGDRGEIQDFDDASGRYVVNLEDSDEFLRVKPSNLLQHVHVTMQGIESQPEMNGKKGTIIAWNDHKGRYQVYLIDMAKVLSLRPTNVVLENGTVAHIVGLQAKPQLNGKFGTIKSWDRASNRYDVQISADQILRLKAENVRV